MEPVVENMSVQCRQLRARAEGGMGPRQGDMEMGRQGDRRKAEGGRLPSEGGDCKLQNAKCKMKIGGGGLAVGGPLAERVGYRRGGKQAIAKCKMQNANSGQNTGGASGTRRRASALNQRVAAICVACCRMRLLYATPRHECSISSRHSPLPVSGSG